MPTPAATIEDVVSFLQIIVARGESHRVQLIKALETDVYKALIWRGHDTLKVIAQADVASQVLKAALAGKWSLEILRLYALNSTISTIQSLNGSQSTNPLDAIAATAKGAFWAELVELLGGNPRA